MSDASSAAKIVPWPQRSALAGRVATIPHPVARATSLSEPPPRPIVLGFGRTGAAALAGALAELGLTPLPRPNRAVQAEGRTLLWLAPDQWLLVGRAEEDEAALLAPLQAARVVAVAYSDAWAVLRLAGPAARDLLQAGTSLDLHPRRFGPDDSARTLFADAALLLHQVGPGDVFELYLDRSIGNFVWEWLSQAGRLAAE